MDTTANANANANTSDTTTVMASLIRRNSGTVAQPLPLLRRTSSVSAKRQQTGNNVNPTQGKKVHSQAIYARNSATARKMISNTVSREQRNTGTQETRLAAAKQRLNKRLQQQKQKIKTSKKSGNPAKRAISLTSDKPAQLPRTTQKKPSALRRSQKAKTLQSGGRRTRKRKQRQTRRK
jgi:hypothetical protein